MLNKKNLVFITLLFVLYFLLFPLNTGKNIYYTRGEALKLIGKKGEVNSESIPYVYNKTAGYFNKELNSFYNMDIKDGIVLLSYGYINYSRNDEFIILRDNNDNEIFKIENTGYPFNINDRLFLISRDRKSVYEVIEGKLVWERDFNSVITSISGNNELVVLGFITGEFVVLNSAGESFFSYEPGGSRVSIVYSVEISEDGKFIGVVSGLDPQRFILYEKRGKEYKPIYVYNFESEYRRSINIDITKGNKKVFIENPKGFTVIDIETEESYLVESSYDLKKVKYIDHLDVYLVHSGARNLNNIKVLTDDNRILMDKDFESEGVSVENSGNLIYIIIDGSVVSLDMKDS